MTKWLVRIFLTAAILGSIPGFGAEHPGLKARRWIEIVDYDAAAGVFDVGLVSEQAVGPFFAEPEALAQAIPALSAERLKKYPRQIVGSRFLLQSDLRIITESEAENRRKKAENRKKTGP